LILDAAGLARVAELRAVAEEAKSKKTREQEETGEGMTRQTLLTFHNGPDEYCAVPLHLVLRVEQVKADEIEFRGGKKVIRYRDGSLPVYALEEAANVDSLEEREEIAVILFRVAGREIGILAIPPLEIIEENIMLDEVTLKQTGISGSAVIRDHTTLMVDIFRLMEALNPEWFSDRQSKSDRQLKNAETGSEEEQTPGSPPGRKILLAEDSSFFRAQVKSFIVSEGYEIIEAPDGLEAWNYLEENPGEIALVVTDIEMPNLNGFELTRNIKSDERFSRLPVIALTSLAGEEDVAKGREVGIDDYQVKLDKEQLLQKIYEYLNK
ncbi:MAG: response regulator, partial [Desulfobia sp.]